MAVVINKETGLAEELPAAKVMEESHKIPLVNREGDVVSAPMSEAREFLKEGYSHPNEQQLKGLLKKAKYGTGSQQALTAAEGAASTATLGLSTLAETKLGGVPEEDIIAREEENPKSKIAGNLAGVLVPGGAIEVLGARAAKSLLGATRGAVGLGRDVMAAKQAASLGARAINNAVQGSVMQGGDEVHKMFLNYPNQTFGTAVANIGLSGALTGALTGVPKGAAALSNAARESKIGTRIGAAKDALQELASKNPEITAAIGSMALGHGALPGAVIGTLARSMGLKGKLGQAAQWMLGKAASTDGKLEPQAVKSLWKYTKAVFKGNKEINQGVESMFNEGASQEAPKMDKKSLEKLDESVKEAGMDPTRMNTGDLASTYADHASAGTVYMARAVQYLNSLRPKEEKLAPMSPSLPPNAVEEGNYQRALRISEQPLAILHTIKQGSLTPEDMHTMQAVHPDLLQVLRSRTFNMMAEQEANGRRMPYKTAMSLSLFLGQPLISSIMPQGIVSNQMVQTSIPAPQKPQQGALKPKPQAFKSLSKESATPGQARELNKQSRVK